MGNATFQQWFWEVEPQTTQKVRLMGIYRRFQFNSVHQGGQCPKISFPNSLKLLVGIAHHTHLDVFN